MHATLYREGNSAIMSGAGFPHSYTADGTEPSVTSNGFTYYPTQTIINLSGCNDIRIACNVVDVSGAAGSVTLSLQYWDPRALGGVGAWMSASASVTVTSAGLTMGSWVSIPQAAQQDTRLRIVMSDETGNGGAVITPLSITLDARV